MANIGGMTDAGKVLESQYQAMRERVLSLAADFDRIERSAGGAQVLAGAKVRELCECLAVIQGTGSPDRAEKVQLLLSDRT